MGMAALDFLDTVNDQYGIDDGHLTANDDTELMTPEVNIQLTSHQMQRLETAINPLAIYFRQLWHRVIHNDG